jgi:hypothetical protein
VGRIKSAMYLQGYAPKHRAITKPKPTPASQNSCCGLSGVT